MYSSAFSLIAPPRAIRSAGAQKTGTSYSFVLARTSANCITHKYLRPMRFGTVCLTPAFDMAPLGARARFHGAPETIADAILSVATSRSWLIYDDREHVSSVQLDVGKVRKAHRVLHALYNIQPNLSFNKSSVKQAIKIVLEKRAGNPAWSLKDIDEKAYITCMTNRLTNVCRCVSQGLCKSRNKPSAPQWVAELPWTQGADTTPQGPAATTTTQQDEAPVLPASSGASSSLGEAGDGDAQHAPIIVLDATGADSDLRDAGAISDDNDDDENDLDGAALASDDDCANEGEDDEGARDSQSQVVKRPASREACRYGYSAEHRNAWRISGLSKGLKEYAVDMLPQADDSPVLAVFADGSTWEVAKILSGQFRNSQRRTSENTVYWSGEHSKTKNRLVIRDRTDRQMLCSAYEQSSQILQVTHTDFGGDGHAAANFLIPIMEGYAADKYGRGDLQTLKLDALNKIKAQRREASGPPAKKTKTCQRREASEPPAMPDQLAQQTHVGVLRRSGAMDLSCYAPPSPSSPRGPAFV